MKNKELVVQVICSNCGMPQTFEVPIKDFANSDDNSHFNTCTECHKWIVGFEIEEFEENEKEQTEEENTND